MPRRRFSLAPLLFLLLWVVWFALPLTRRLALSQWRAHLGINKTDPPPGASRDADLMRAMHSNVPRGSGWASWKEKTSGTLATLSDKYLSDATICAAMPTTNTSSKLANFKSCAKMSDFE